jgi:hypothetical protein
LEERDNFLVQDAVPVTLGVAQGTRTLSFQVAPQLDTSDQASAVGDRLLVYLVDAAHPTQTLLDRGQPGTALFALGAGGAAEFPAGLVHFDGSVVSIDVTGVTSTTSGLLVFQLLGGDSATGSLVTVSNIADTTDPNGVPGTPMPPPPAPGSPGAALDLTTLTASSSVTVLVNNVRLDPTTGHYAAELSLHNGGAALGRNVAVVFPGLPAGVQVTNVSGTTTAGAPYVNLHDAIADGGLAAGATSAAVLVTLTDASLLRFPLTPQVLVGAANTAPVLSPIGPVSVMPGQRLEVHLQASDADGDSVSFSLRNAANLPMSTLQADGTLVFTPTPDQVGSYPFTVVASSRPPKTSPSP